MLRVLAVDLGASAARVSAVDLDATPPAIEQLHRYEHAPVRDDSGSLRWDWRRLVREVARGLETGIARGPIASIGVDTWGVDYGLLDADGRLLSSPYCYRDGRTAAWKRVAERLGVSRLYRQTGIRPMAMNTLFQLAAHDPAELTRARRVLMLPDLLVHTLTGEYHAERTSAGTSGLVDLATGSWSPSIQSDIGVDRALFPAIADATTRAGAWRGVPMHLVAGHDTASAVVALPRSTLERRVFISSGTWMLVGAERDGPDTSDAALAAGFSNEPGAFSGVRFLKNVMGLWMLEECRREWPDEPLTELLAKAGDLPPRGPTVDATDERFLAPDDMAAEVRAAAALPTTASRAQVVRCVLDSLATAAASAVDELARSLGGVIAEVAIVGGGTRNVLLNRLIEGGGPGAGAHRFPRGHDARQCIGPGHRARAVRGRRGRADGVGTGKLGARYGSVWLRPRTRAYAGSRSRSASSPRYTTLPPTMVASARTSSIAIGSLMRKTSPESRTKSA